MAAMRCVILGSFASASYYNGGSGGRIINNGEEADWKYNDAHYQAGTNHPGVSTRYQNGERPPLIGTENRSDGTNRGQGSSQYIPQNDPVQPRIIQGPQDGQLASHYVRQLHEAQQARHHGWQEQEEPSFIHPKSSLSKENLSAKAHRPWETAENQGAQGSSQDMYAHGSNQSLYGGHGSLQGGHGSQQGQGQYAQNQYGNIGRNQTATSHGFRVDPFELSSNPDPNRMGPQFGHGPDGQKEYYHSFMQRHPSGN